MDSTLSDGTELSFRKVCGGVKDFTMSSTVALNDLLDDLNQEIGGYKLKNADELEGGRRKRPDGVDFEQLRRV